jgi:hypothetical protein
VPPPAVPPPGVSGGRLDISILSTKQRHVPPDQVARAVRKFSPGFQPTATPGSFCQLDS